METPKKTISTQLRNKSMNSRKKGLLYVKEVEKILQAMDHQTCGPFYKPAFFKDRMSVIHFDVFGVFDLISFNGDEFIFHQVSTLSNKAAKIKAIKDKLMVGWVWCRVDHPVGYRIFQIDWKGEVRETEMQFIPKAILGSGKGDK